MSGSNVETWLVSWWPVQYACQGLEDVAVKKQMLKREQLWFANRCLKHGCYAITFVISRFGVHLKLSTVLNWINKCYVQV